MFLTLMSKKDLARPIPVQNQAGIKTNTDEINCIVWKNRPNSQEFDITDREWLMHGCSVFSETP
jgi:hypothetical protein